MGMEGVGKHSRFMIDSSGIVNLTQTKINIKCDHCDYTLGHVGTDVILFRTLITVYDGEKKEFMLKCGRCHKYTSVAQSVGCDDEIEK